MPFSRSKLKINFIEESKKALSAKEWSDLGYQGRKNYINEKIRLYEENTGYWQSIMDKKTEVKQEHRLFMIALLLGIIGNLVANSIDSLIKYFWPDKQFLVNSIIIIIFLIGAGLLYYFHKKKQDELFDEIIKDMTVDNTLFS